MLVKVLHQVYLFGTQSSFINSIGILSNDNIIIEAPNNTTLTVKGGNLVLKDKDETHDENILVEMSENKYGKITSICLKICSKSIMSRPR